MNTTISLSKKGIKELKKSITGLEKELSNTRNKLRAMDKSTSHDGRFERIETLNVLEAVEQELFEKRELLKNVKLAPKKEHPMRIAIGSVVVLIDRRGYKLEYTLVESVEANPSDGRISVKSPLGMGLIGKTIKDTIEFATRSGVHQMQVAGIS